MQKQVDHSRRWERTARDPEDLVAPEKYQHVILDQNKTLAGHPHVFSFPGPGPPNDSIGGYLRRAEPFPPQPFRRPLQSSKRENGYDRARHPKPDGHRFDRESGPERHPHNESKGRQAENEKQDRYNPLADRLAGMRESSAQVSAKHFPEGQSCQVVGDQGNPKS
jgi:hypothetical protein